jgi:hypothetical protein
MISGGIHSSRQSIVDGDASFFLHVGMVDSSIPPQCMACLAMPFLITCAWAWSVVGFSTHWHNVPSLKSKVGSRRGGDACKDLALHGLVHDLDI